MANEALDYCLENRRSARIFEERGVDRKTIRELLEKAILAPSASNRQPWRFVMVDDAELIRKIKAFAPGMGGNLPAVIVAFCLDNTLLKTGKDMAVYDVAMAAENLMLAAVEKGLGTCAIKSFQPVLVSRQLNLPAEISPELLVILGYPVKAPVMPKRKPLDTLLKYNRWEDDTV